MPIGKGVRMVIKDQDSTRVQLPGPSMGWGKKGGSLERRGSATWQEARVGGRIPHTSPIFRDSPFSLQRFWAPPPS